MITLRNKKSMTSGILCALIILVLWSLNACKSKEEAENVVSEPLTLSSITPIFGEAKEDVSGAFDFSQGDQEMIVSYRFFTQDFNDLDSQIGTELTPKIQAFYKAFKQADRVILNVSVPRSDLPGEWKPFASFAVSRKLVQETDWSQLLAKDLFTIALELKHID